MRAWSLDEDIVLSGVANVKASSAVSYVSAVRVVTVIQQVILILFNGVITTCSRSPRLRR